LAGVAHFHELVARNLSDNDSGQVVVGIETDRGPWVIALIAPARPGRGHGHGHGPGRRSPRQQTGRSGEQQTGLPQR
jgi:hypothetical protein